MRVILFSILLFYSEYGFCQEYNRSKVWVCGYFKAVTFDFNNNNLIVDTFQNAIQQTPYPLFTFGGSNICDTNGLVSFSCNGFILYNKSGYGIEGWDSINSPFGYKLEDYYNHDGFFNQMSIILPKKGNTYYVFTAGMSDPVFDEAKSGIDFRFDVLTDHIVDMDANGGAGKVLSKNNILMQDARLSHNRMTAVRHANGRDWWLVKPHVTEQIFYTFLVQPDTILGPFTNYSNFPMDTFIKTNKIYGIQGHSAFSPDGNWYASTEAAYKGVFVYRFDRCTGLFTDYHFYQQPSYDTTYHDWSVSACFSEDSKLLYLITAGNIWQCDLADTSTSSLIHITGPDTLLAYFPEYYSTYLAPNGKMYVGNTNGTNKSMSFIDQPNVRGTGCNFKGRGNGALSQPYTNLMIPPNMPNYGLGALKGSACDTLNKLPEINAINIYPNPANDVLHIEWPINNQATELNVYDLLGNVIFKHTIAQGQQQFSLDVSGLPRALYMLKLKVDGKEEVRKFLKK